jgi:hypothetical protein
MSPPPISLSGHLSPSTGAGVTVHLLIFYGWIVLDIVGNNQLNLIICSGTEC